MMLISLFTILIDLSMVGVILGLLTTTLLIDRKIKDTLKIVAVIVVAAAGIWGISSLKISGLKIKARFLKKFNLKRNSFLRRKLKIIC